MKYQWSMSVDFMDGSAASSNGLSFDKVIEEVKDFIADTPENTEPQHMAKTINLTGNVITDE